MIDLILFGIILIQAAVIALLVFFYQKTVLNLSEKIAIPLYKEDAKKTVFVSPGAAARTDEAKETPNLPAVNSDLIDLESVDEEDLYRAAIGRSEL